MPTLSEAGSTDWRCANGLINGQAAGGDDRDSPPLSHTIDGADARHCCTSG
ncbi:MAG UNVERIFIED_CONTAM: hypothetical protein LVR18_03090 [Planctomycetaceae bacterium]